VIFFCILNSENLEASIFVVKFLKLLKLCSAQIEKYDQPEAKLISSSCPIEHLASLQVFCLLFTAYSNKLKGLKTGHKR